MGDAIEKNKLHRIGRRKCVKDLGGEKGESPVWKETDRMLNPTMRLSRVKIKNKLGFDREQEQRF